MRKTKTIASVCHYMKILWILPLVHVANGDQRCTAGHLLVKVAIARRKGIPCFYGRPTYSLMRARIMDDLAAQDV